MVDMRSIRGVLIDLAGVLYDDEAAVSGAVQALARLRASGFSVRFATNTTRKTRATLVRKLNTLGFEVSENEIFSAPMAARSIIAQHQLRPMMLIHDSLEPEFEDVSCQNPNAVLLGDAGERFTYDALDRAFRLLMEGATLLVMGRSRYFSAADGLHLDAGPFAALLEEASGVQGEVLGKPAAPFFQAAVSDMQLDPKEVVMVGDDLHADVAGAKAAGLHAVLVQTGKYRSGDEANADQGPDYLAEDFPRFVDWITKP